MNNLRMLDPVFGDTLDSALRRFFSPLALENDASTPKIMRVDVSEKNEAYEVKADIPGVRKEDISVRIDGNVVQIDAEVNRGKETKEKDGTVLCSERYWGSISRTFSLPQDVENTKADAKYVDGVLTLVLPKKVSTEVRRITVH